LEQEGDEKEIVQVYEKGGEEQGQTFSVWASVRMRSSLPSPVVSKASESTLPSPLHIHIHVIYNHMHKHTNTHTQNTHLNIVKVVVEVNEEECK
jgi:hypothetical protein